MLLFSLPGLGKRRTTTGVHAERAAADDRSSRPTTAKAEEIAARLRQLDQLKEAGLLDEAAYEERRRQILAEL